MSNQRFVGRMQSFCLALVCLVSPGRGTASTFLGIDFGYQSLSLMTDLDPETMLQMDLGDAGYWGGVAVGVDYLKLYQRQKTSTYDPEVFYGFGAMIAAIGHGGSNGNDGNDGHDGQNRFGLGLRFPFGALWNLKDTPLQVGISAVPIFAVSDSYSRIRIAMSIPFRWRLD